MSYQTQTIDNPVTILILTFVLLAALVIIINFLRDQYLKFRLRRKLRDIDIDKMDGTSFEILLMLIFRNLGYRVSLVGGAGDYGADLIMKRYGRKIVVQAKRYKNNVGVHAVMEVHAARRYYRATDAIVVTTAYFTKNAKNLADGCGVRLYDRDILFDLICLCSKNPNSDLNRAIRFNHGNKIVVKRKTKTGETHLGYFISDKKFVPVIIRDQKGRTVRVMNDFAVAVL